MSDKTASEVVLEALKARQKVHKSEIGFGPMSSDPQELLESMKARPHGQRVLPDDSDLRPRLLATQDTLRQYEEKVIFLQGKVEALETLLERLFQPLIPQDAEGEEYLTITLGEALERASKKAPG